MEFPFLSLSKKPRFTLIQYTDSNGTKVIVSDNQPHGIASIFDYDLMIWLLSQLRHSLNRGDTVSRRIQFSRHSYLHDVRRHSGGDEYLTSPGDVEFNSAVDFNDDEIVNVFDLLAFRQRYNTSI